MVVVPMSPKLKGHASTSSVLTTSVNWVLNAWRSAVGARNTVTRMVTAGVQACSNCRPGAAPVAAAVTAAVVALCTAASRLRRPEQPAVMLEEGKAMPKESVETTAVVEASLQSEIGAPGLNPSLAVRA